MKKMIFLVGALLATNARASSFNEKCTEISTCAEAVSQLIGQKYILDSNVKGKVLGTSNLELTKENAELLLTNMLFLNGYSRVPLAEPNTFQIVRQRDARDSAIPLFKADQKHFPQDLPNTWDMVTLQYKATHADAVDGLARMSRSFMPANSRIIPDELSGSILVTDSAANIRKMYEIIKDADQKPTAEMKKRWVEREKERHMEKMVEKKEMHAEMIEKQEWKPGAGQNNPAQKAAEESTKKN